MHSTDFHPLFLQLQSRYPTSALLTELVQLQDGQYIVKALVQISGTAIASGLAAATTLEQAEDQARLRVLALLGIGSSLPETVPAPPRPSLDPLPSPGNGFAPLPPPAPPTWLDQDRAVAALPTLPLPPETPLAVTATTVMATTPNPEVQEFPLADQPVPDEVAFAEFDTLPPVADLPTAPVDAPPPQTSSDRPTPKAKKGTRAEAALEALRNAEAAAAQLVPEAPPAPAPSPAPAPELPLPEPDDLSFLIAQTDVEMDRIGWTKQQGREYLKATYNKATRQRLDADELMDFLNYLRALPSLHGL